MKPKIYLIQVARALMHMKGLSVQDIAARTDIPLDTIEAFLGGMTSVITEKSMSNLFLELGFGANGLLDDTVHFWHMSFGRSNNKKHLIPIDTLVPIVGEHTAYALGKRGNLTPILIKGENIRLVLMVKTQPFVRVTPEDLGLRPGAYDTKKGFGDITPYYEDLIFSQKLKPSYFDLILSGDFSLESIDILRMVALEYNMTITDLVKHVTNQDTAVGVLDESSEQYAGSNIMNIMNRKASNE